MPHASNFGKAYQIVVRLRAPVVRDLRRLAGFGERSTSWLIEQAFKELLRDVELGSVTAIDLKEVNNPRQIRGSLGGNRTVTFGSVWPERVFAMKHQYGVDVSALVRFGIDRYLRRRKSLLTGETAYVDSLFGEGPELPP